MERARFGFKASRELPGLFDPVLVSLLGRRVVLKCLRYS